MRTFVLIAVLLLGSAAAAETLSGKAAIVDGDTVTIGGTTVHLYGIDAPEMDQFCKDKKGNRFNCGHAAMRRLFLYIGADPLNCIVRERWKDSSVAATCQVKSYFRRTENGATRGEMFDVALEMVLTGHAFPDRAQAIDYDAAGESAQAKRLGLWSSTFELPWEWRARRKRMRD
jgi:endonuclease YncB( thermonuclease family)